MGRRGRTRGLLLGLALPAALLLAAELGVRAVQALRGEPSAAEVRRELAQLVVTMTLPVGAEALPPIEDGAPVPHPFLTWDTPEGLALHAQRSDYFRSPKAAEQFDVLVLGGAAALGLAGEGKRSFHAVLRQESELLAGRKPRFHSLGQASFKQPQQLNALTYAFALGWKPDLVVNVDGFNELALGFENASEGVHPVNPAAGSWRQLDLSEGSDGLAMDHLLDAHHERSLARAELGRLTRPVLGRSALLALGARGRIEAHRERFEWSVLAFRALATPERPLAVAGPPFDHRRGDTALLEAILTSWFEGAVAMDAVCRARGVPFVQVLSPPRREGPGSAPADRAGFLRRGYPRMRALGAGLTGRGVQFVDASRALDGAGGFPEEERLTAPALRFLAAFVARAYVDGAKGG